MEIREFLLIFPHHKVKTQTYLRSDFSDRNIFLFKHMSTLHKFIRVHWTRLKWISLNIFFFALGDNINICLIQIQSESYVRVLSR